LDESLIEYLESFLLENEPSTEFEAAFVDLLKTETKLPQAHIDELLITIAQQLANAGFTIPVITTTSKSAKSSSEEEEFSLEEGGNCGVGGCLMCEREMPLTRHHLIPRMVHSDKHYKKHFSREQLHKTVLICRPCHSAIHSFIDERTMAREYNTLEVLLQHEAVQKWIPYASKQKTRIKMH